MTDFLNYLPQGLKVLETAGSESKKNNSSEPIQGYPLPSSVAVERLFSIGKDVVKPKLLSLSGQNFEILVFLKDRKQNTASSSTYNDDLYASDKDFFY